MAEHIISASGVQHGLIIDSAGRALVNATVSAGSEMYIKAGSVIVTNSITATQASSDYSVGSSINSTSGLDSTIINYLIPTGSTYNLTGFDLTGTSDGKYSLKHNSDILTKYRTNAAQQNIKKEHNFPVSFAGGSIILSVIHGELLSQNFFGAIYGYLS